MSKAQRLGKLLNGLGMGLNNGLLNHSLRVASTGYISHQAINGRECSKKSVQQGRSRFDARSVRFVREHGKRARTPLAAFFNIPNKAR